MINTDLLNEIIKQGGLFGISVLLLIFCWQITTDHMNRSTDASLALTETMTKLTQAIEDNIEFNKALISKN